MMGNEKVARQGIKGVGNRSSQEVPGAFSALRIDPRR
jgi:hypothetical protein